MKYSGLRPIRIRFCQLIPPNNAGLVGIVRLFGVLFDWAGFQKSPIGKYAGTTVPKRPHPDKGLGRWNTTLMCKFTRFVTG